MLSYRTAIIGLGNIAWRYDVKNHYSQIYSRSHARTYSIHPRTTLAGGCSVDSKDRDDFSRVYRVPVYADHTTMLQELCPDIVSICSPAEYHFEHIMSCLENGVRMIWLEKPAARNSAQIDIILQRQKELETRTKILVGYMRRYTEIFVNLKKVFHEKTLGQIDSINISYSKGLIENGSHYIDLIFFLLGDPPFAEVSFVLPDEKQENPSFGLRFPGKPQVIFSGLNVPYHSLDISISCEHGRVSVLYGGLKGRWEVKSEQELFPGNFRLREEKDIFLGRGGFKYAMTKELDDLISSYEDDHQPLSSLEKSKSVLNVLESVWQKVH